MNPTQMAAKLYDARDTAKVLLGERYPQTMQDFGAMIDMVAAALKIERLAAMTKLATQAMEDNTPFIAMYVMAAAVELEEPSTPTAEESPKYYHGGPEGRQRGAYVLPPTVTRTASCSEYGGSSVHRRDRVYVTTDFNAALLYAAAVPRGVVYQVEPVGELEPDPDCSQEGLSYQCTKARVLRCIKPSWEQIHTARVALLEPAHA